MVSWFAWVLLGLAEAAPPPSAEPVADVVRPIAAGVAVNWTRRRLEITEGAADPTVAGDARPLEERAIRQIEQRVGDAFARVPLAPGVVARDAANVDPAEAVRSWWVIETRYFASGRVEVVGAVDLARHLGAWNAGRALVREVDAPSPLDAGPTGVLVDARGTGLVPTFAPEIRDPEGEVLFDGVMWRNESWKNPPVTWVSSAAAPEAATAGSAPEAFVAAGTSADGQAIVLSEADAARYRSRVAGSDAVRTGHVVIVVDVIR